MFAGLLIVSAAISLGAASADAPPADAAAKPPAAADAAPAETVPAPTTADLGPPGDLVTLKSGRVYRGFQVVNSSSAEVELEVTEDVTIKVPRRQIVSIQYDEIDPIVEREKKKAAAAAASEATMRLLSGQKVPPQIQTKLAADVSAPSISYDKRDIQDAVSELNKHPKIDNLLEVDKPILSRPPDQKQWTYSAPPGTTLAGVLEGLKKAVPGVATVIRNNKVLITDEKTALEIVTAADPQAAIPTTGTAPGAPAATATTIPAATPPPPAAPAPRT
ncbi:MAG: hypothetical protein IT366_03870 [Candidatus Hydrogenedentes bacterium]|nr:hypothetical protein [Candidatus Hydrogenedentota bacterium]